MGIGQKYIRGFTIVELLIVIVIIGILATVTAIVYSGIQANARDTSVLSDLDTMDGLQTSYSLKNGGNAKPYYSGNGPDTELDFAPSGDNVIDVVVNGDDYCIRGYNTKSSSYKTLSTAATKESNDGVCESLAPSLAATSDSPHSFTSIIWTERSVGATQNWSSYTMSADGTTLYAGIYCGIIYRSTDSGATWTPLYNAGSRCWTALATSNDGTTVVGVTLDYIYTSTNSGTSWTVGTSAGSTIWNDVASSSDGTKLVAAPQNGYLYTSTDSGASWTQQTAAGSHQWNQVASSADGTTIAAADNSGSLSITTNSGVSWALQYYKGYAIALSSDGLKMFAGRSDGNVSTSTDGGSSWTVRTTGSSSTIAWKFKSSADGSKLTGRSFDGHLWFSPDSGETWTKLADSPVDIGAVSADGLMLFSGKHGGDLYIGVYN